MALSISTLTNYTDQLSQKLMHKALLEGVTNKYIKIIPNVFQNVTLNLIDENSPFTVQADTVANIGFTDSGTTTLSQVTLQVCALKFMQQYPIYAQGGGIEQTYLMYLYDAPSLKGSYHDEIPLFEEVWTDMLVKYISQAVDTAEWIGGWSAGSANGHSGDTQGNTSTNGLNTCQGFLYQLYNTAASGGTATSAVTTAWSGVPTVGNINSIVQAMVANIPVNILDQPLIIFTSPAIVQMYKQALINLNYFNVFVSDATSVQNGGDGSAKMNSLTQSVPGQNILMVGTYGLTNNTSLVMSYADNFVFATALESDYSTIKSWYSLDFDQYRCMSRWRQASAFAWPQYVVLY